MRNGFEDRRISGDFEKNDENVLLYSSWAASLFSIQSSCLNYCA